MSSNEFQRCKTVEKVVLYNKEALGIQNMDNFRNGQTISKIAELCGKNPEAVKREIQRNNELYERLTCCHPSDNMKVVSGYGNAIRVTGWGAGGETGQAIIKLKKYAHLSANIEFLQCKKGK